MSDRKLSNRIDLLIFIFSVVFMLTLTNSIFLNQLGYFGALLTILLKLLVEKKNQFSKSGLELAFILYIIAELLASIFSIEPSHSFRNLFKRFILIPTLYTFVTASIDFKRTKQFVIIYIFGALITLIYYLIQSYDYFINNLYQTQASGPSVFQYPITSSELMSFSVLILFAFLINEKTNVKYRLLIFLLFLINLLALLATYKRTGWMGTAAGILLILILTRRWYWLAGILLVGIVFSFVSKNISQINIYTINSSEEIKPVVLSTNGKAVNVLCENNKIYVSDFDNGLIIYKDTTQINKVILPAPIVEFRKWTDQFFIARLADTRFILLKSVDGSNFQQLDQFYPSGHTMESRVANNMFYVYDEDSGFTIYKSPVNLEDTIRLINTELINQKTFYIDSNYCVLYSKDDEVTVFQLENLLPKKIILKQSLSHAYDLKGFINSRLIFNSDEGVKIYSFESGKLNLLQTNKKLGNLSFLTSDKDRLFGFNVNGEYLEFEYPLKDKLIIKSTIKLQNQPGSIAYCRDKLYTTFNKTSRLSSFVDPYYPSNYSRLAFWRAGWKIFLDYPFFGVGDIDLAKLYRIYKRPYDKEIQGHLHNNYFHSLATLGAIGFLAIMFLLIKIFLVHLSLYKKLEDVPFASSYALGAIGAYFAFLIAGLTEYNFGDHEVITMVWFTLALSFAFASNIESKKLEN